MRIEAVFKTKHKWHSHLLTVTLFTMYSDTGGCLSCSIFSVSFSFVVKLGQIFDRLNGSRSSLNTVVSSAKKRRFPSIPGVFPQNISHSFFKLFLRKGSFLWVWTQQVVEPLKNYWYLSALKLFSPTQLTANHRTDHLCWDQLWPMRETKLTGVNLASSCLSSSVATVSLHQASSIFVRRVVYSFQEFHSFTYISSKIPSIISFPVMASSAASILIFSFDFELFETLWRVWKYHYHWFLGLYLSSKVSP